MKVRLLAIGQKMPAWVEQGYNEYAKRLNGQVTLELVEIASGGKASHMPATKRVAHEADLLLGRVNAQDTLIALDGRGKAWSTERLSENLQSWLMDGRDIALFIGGADGLDERCRQQAQQLWSLGPLTLPHPLVRVLVAEQLYRAVSILQGHPYHRAG
jgi:23S rRNA (pseudouridine1915-N3)-methyltransferase